MPQRLPPPLAKKKAQEIEKEIRYAEQHHNQGRIDGLKKSAKSGTSQLP
ncbi:Periplasmic protein YqjC [Cronobacter sakazakii 680]|nr:Periplasmic protein YqjC [Cronobacter sakazakii 680]